MATSTHTEYRVQRRGRDGRWVPLKRFGRQVSALSLEEARAVVQHYRRYANYNGRRIRFGRVRYVKVTTTTSTKVKQEVVK